MRQLITWHGMAMAANRPFLLLVLSTMVASTPTNARRRKRGAPSALQVATVSVLSAASWTSAFQMPAGWLITRCGLHHHHNRPAAIAPSVCYFSSSPTVSNADISDLESLTIKELRQRIKEWGLETKGLSGKRKAELISFMVQSVNGNASSQVEVEAGPVTTPPAPPTVGPEPTRKRQRTRMPPLPQSGMNDTPKEQLDAGNHGENQAAPRKSSPKHKIYRDVMDTYPPLSDYIDPVTLEYYNPLANNKPQGLGDEDIRHTHHPMLKGMRTSDLDVVFVGTASCTPGITRGVSCTALRLQWRRRKGQVEGNKKNNKKGQRGRGGANVNDMLSSDGRYDESGNGDFNGGSDAAGRTWIFDCGESTQVSDATDITVARTTSRYLGAL